MPGEFANREVPTQAAPDLSGFDISAGYAGWAVGAGFIYLLYLVRVRISSFFFFCFVVVKFRTVVGGFCQIVVETDNGCEQLYPPRSMSSLTKRQGKKKGSSVK